jgi:hypothetical protein
MKIKITKLLPMLIMLGFVVPVMTAEANSADVKIQLLAAPEYPGAKGTAKYRDRGGEREFEVEVQVSRRHFRSVFTVSVNGATVGKITIRALGRGRLNLNSDLGQAVPQIAPGSIVGVTTSTGQIVFAGQF